MAINPNITQRIRDLGGSAPTGDIPLRDYLLATSFPHYLYPKDWDYYGIETFLDKNRTVYDTDQDSFLDLIEQHYFTKHDFACGQDFWQPRVFTPLTPGTEDFKEWEPWFAADTDLTAVRSICGDGQLEFVQIVDSYGFPDHYYVCLSDPMPENPTVFGTDHEEFFREISATQSLLDFLNSYCTRDDFRQIVRKFLSDQN